MRRPALALLLGCLLLVAGASALDGYDYYQTIEYAGCDQDIYQQDIVIHRTTGTAYNETAGGLETWHIYVGEHCREDYGDVRFTNSTGELAYYIWPGYDAASAQACVRLEGATSAGAVTIHYGNPSATATSDGKATYPLFDHFDGDAIDTEIWQNTATGGAISVANGALTLSGDLGANKGLQSRASFGTGTALEASFKGPTAASVGKGLIGFGWYNTASYAAFLDATDSNARFMPYASPSKYVSGGPTMDGVFSPLAIARKTTANIDYLYRTTKMSITGATAAGDLPVGLGMWGASNSLNYILDYILVRAYSATPPAATTFSGEQETAAPPVTAFTASPTAGLAPLTVTFTDRSTGTPTAWAWTFGDGATSTDQDPQHTYTTPGTYSVNLTATNEYGSDYELKTDYITVYAPITAQFTTNITGGTAPLTVQFTDRSTGGPTSWSWSFGDGNTSTAQNPAHTYTTAGTHAVTLTASHPYDSDTETKTAYITVAVLQPFPGLTLIPRDLAGTGLYTDINGNNRLDYNDLTIFFQNLAWAKTAQPIACFDFNGNGWLDYNDVITLFSTIMEEHI